MNQPLEIPIKSLRRISVYKRRINRKHIHLLAAQLKKEKAISFSEALIVRKIAAGQYEIIDGYKRLLACKLAKFDTVPVWVMDCTDNEAVVEHLKRNSGDGAISKMELALTLLKKFPFENDSKGGRGKTGDMGPFAKSIGKSKSLLYQLRNAAKVVSLVGIPVEQWSLVFHIEAISAAPQSLWKALADEVLAMDYSVKEIQSFARSFKPLEPFKISHKEAQLAVELALEEGADNAARVIAGMLSLPDQPTSDFEVEIDPFKAACHSYKSEKLGATDGSVWSIIQNRKELEKGSGNIIRDIEELYGLHDEVTVDESGHVQLVSVSRPKLDNDQLLEKQNVFLNDL